MVAINGRDHFCGGLLVTFTTIISDVFVACKLFLKVRTRQTFSAVPFHQKVCDKMSVTCESNIRCFRWHINCLRRCTYTQLSTLSNFTKKSSPKCQWVAALVSVIFVTCKLLLKVHTHYTFCSGPLRRKVFAEMLGKSFGIFPPTFTQ